MIRASVVIAAVAILLSLLGHMMGFGVMVRPLPVPATPQEAREPAPISTTFEDLATETTEPPPPEKAQEPEAPEQQPEEPERAEEVTPTEALVASSNPQDTPTPEAGETPTTELEALEPSQSDSLQTPEPPSGQEGQADQTTAPAPTPEVTPQAPAPAVQDSVAPEPVETTTPTQTTPSQTAPAQTAPAQTVPAQTVPAETAPSPSVTAALTPQVQPVTPSATPPVTSVLPGLVPPVQSEPIEPEAPVTPLAPVPEVKETEDDEEEDGEEQGTELAVASSLRPPQAPKRPNPSPHEDKADVDRLLAPPEEPIESPLAAYARDRANGSIRSNSTDSLFGGSGGTGNSTTTNYAGRVLVHINRTSVERVSARGWGQVHFQINPDGTLAWVNVVDGSGSLEAVSVVKAQIRAAAPFPRPPSGRRRQFSFHYNLN